MKQSFLSAFAFLVAASASAQNVTIPDANFKSYLVGYAAINTNGDTEIQLSEAAAYTGQINCSSYNISDLTGIEAFTGLSVLYCNDNELTALNVLNNTALTILVCNNNQLTSLDVSSNIALNELYCYNNQLTSLNVANGNNTNFTNFFAHNNPNLTCIQVDDAAYSTSNWTYIDATAYFSLSCSYVNIGVSQLGKEISVYPNPVVNHVKIHDLKSTLPYQLITTSGQVVQQGIVAAEGTILMNDLTPGVYLLRLTTENETYTKRIIKQ